MSTGESGAGRQRLLVTGFDPFHLDVDITQSNPSGLAALALDGTTLDAGGQRVSVATAVMPVRFVDFDEGLVESFFRPHFESGNLVLAVTISMGRDAFDLERFPGRRRSAAVTDNLNVLTGANSSNPKVPRLGDRALDGPEFVEFSLPAQSMASVSGRWLIRDNRQVTTLEKGTLIVDHLRDLEGLTAVAGSGGGYLSNEISYRTLLLNQRLSTRLPVGHLHTPKVAGYDEALENEMVEQIRRILTAAVGAVLSGQ